MKTIAVKPAGMTFIVIGLFLLLLLDTGCGAWLMKSGSGSIPEKDPFSGWNRMLAQDRENLNRFIVADYQAFIQQLPAEEKNYVGDIEIYENADGRHAVSIEVFSNRTSALWYYGIIYDRNNSRIRVFKYGYSRYRS